MILVIGPTGRLRREVSRQLLCAGFGVRVHTGDAAGRNPRSHLPREDLREEGAEVVSGDLRRPTARDAALRGVRQILALPAERPASPVERLRPEPPAGELLLAAKRAGVRRLVGLSASDPACSPELLARSHRATERWVGGFGLPATFVHPLHHLPNLATLARYTAERARCPVPENREPEPVMLAPEDLPVLVEAVLTGGASCSAEVYLVAGAALAPCYELAAETEAGRCAPDYATGHATGHAAGYAPNHAPATGRF